MNSRLYYITGSGGELPASAADTIGVNDQNIVQSRLEFECIYCGKAHRTTFALPVNPEKTFRCDNCQNEFRLFDGLQTPDDEEGYRATDIRTLPVHLDEREGVRRLAMRVDSPLFDWVARGLPQYVGTGILLIAFVVLAAAAAQFGSALGQLLTLVGFGLLIVSAGIPTLTHAAARRAAREAGVEFDNMDRLTENREVYEFVQSQQTTVHAERETEE